MSSCQHQLYRATRYNPAEYCEEEAEEGSEYCMAHNEEAWLADRADEEYARRKEGYYD